MFTGIIKAQQKIIGIREKGLSRHVTIQRPPRQRFASGSSIAINGICSTIAQVKRSSFAVEYMPETVAVTTVNHWGIGQRVNLEPSLRLGEELGGHFVMGHIDGIGHVVRIDIVGRSRVIRLEVPHKMMRFISPKGSVTIDGVSLTVACVVKNTLSVSLVDYTLRHTTLGSLSRGQRVNIELDSLAKYVHTLMKK